MGAEASKDAPNYKYSAKSSTFNTDPHSSVRGSVLRVSRPTNQEEKPCSVTFLDFGKNLDRNIFTPLVYKTRPTRSKHPLEQPNARRQTCKSGIAADFSPSCFRPAEFAADFHCLDIFSENSIDRALFIEVVIKQFSNFEPNNADETDYEHITRPDFDFLTDVLKIHEWVSCEKYVQACYLLTKIRIIRQKPLAIYFYKDDHSFAGLLSHKHTAKCIKHYFALDSEEVLEAINSYIKTIHPATFFFTVDDYCKIVSPFQDKAFAVLRVEQYMRDLSVSTGRPLTQTSIFTQNGSLKQLTDNSDVLGFLASMKPYKVFHWPMFTDSENSDISIDSHGSFKKPMNPMTARDLPTGRQFLPNRGRTCDTKVSDYTE